MTTASITDSVHVSINGVDCVRGETVGWEVGEDSGWTNRDGSPYLSAAFWYPTEEMAVAAMHLGMKEEPEVAWAMVGGVVL